MRIEELTDFIKLHGFGEYQISFIRPDEVVVTPFTGREIVATPEVLMEMIARRDAEKAGNDL